MFDHPYTRLPLHREEPLPPRPHEDFDNAAPASPALALLRKLNSTPASANEQAHVYVEAFNAAAGQLRAEKSFDAGIEDALLDLVEKRSNARDLRLGAARLLSDLSRGTEYAAGVASYFSALLRREHDEGMKTVFRQAIDGHHEAELDGIRALAAGLKAGGAAPKSR